MILLVLLSAIIVTFGGDEVLSSLILLEGNQSINISPVVMLF